MERPSRAGPSFHTKMAPPPPHYFKHQPEEPAMNTTHTRQPIHRRQIIYYYPAGTRAVQSVRRHKLMLSLTSLFLAAQSVNRRRSFPF